MKEGSFGHHFGKDAAHAPHVDGTGVAMRAQEDFRGSIPQSHNLFIMAETHFSEESSPPHPPSSLPKGGKKSHLMGIRTHWNAKGPAQAKIGQFDGPFGVNEQVLGLQVTM